MRRVEVAARNHLSLALASSTWRSLESTHRRMLQFKWNWESRSEREIDVPTAVVLWLTRKMLGEPGRAPIVCSSALQYLQDLKSAQRRVGAPISDSQVVRDFERSLRRQGAMRPTRQAVPATHQDIQRVLRKEAGSQVGLAIALAWAGAARVSDVTRLTVGDVSWEDGFVAVNWSQTKSDPFRLGVTTGLVLSEDWSAELRRHVEGRPPGELILSVSYAQVKAALKRARPELTGHSIRRGALFRLLQKGLHLEEIRRVSRHSSLDALVRYLPAGKLAVARETATSSGLLAVNVLP
ncbi:hypothetical protein DIPPA_04989 [Diplonema papillatum]|nr:hypothetical protein DIPPA_32468 [Diplonema papillatum]KAJ9439711.1 hypothetical protein DIPPA_14183 [Diplonema papillatum]KAJ9440724.1 hypothetical protein DIPPA_05302 [Diplonema papillatum]KAJ9455948.1 hypothetical protein DIPPA_33652 [Diplonema papillatum]KAJ9466182.1 hypothetical protein DIPPA_04989 [Diplonema papillatum]